MEIDFDRDSRYWLGLYERELAEPHPCSSVRRARRASISARPRASTPSSSPAAARRVCSPSRRIRRTCERLRRNVAANPALASAIEVSESRIGLETSAGREHGVDRRARVPSRRLRAGSREDRRRGERGGGAPRRAAAARGAQAARDHRDPLRRPRCRLPLAARGPRLCRPDRRASLAGCQRCGRSSSTAGASPEATRARDAAPDFGRLAAEYDRLRPVDDNWREVFELVVREGDLRGRRVLDCGCGTGRLSQALAESAASKVWGVDPEPEMLRVAAGNVPAGVGLKAGPCGGPAVSRRLVRARGPLARLPSRRPAGRVCRAAPRARRRRTARRRHVRPRALRELLARSVLPVHPGRSTARVSQTPTSSARSSTARASRTSASARVRSGRAITRDQALERIERRHISTFDLLERRGARTGTHLAMNELPPTVEYPIEWLIAVAEPERRRRHGALAPASRGGATQTPSGRACSAKVSFDRKSGVEFTQAPPRRSRATGGPGAPGRSGRVLQPADGPRPRPRRRRRARGTGRHVHGRCALLPQIAVLPLAARSRSAYGDDVPELGATAATGARTSTAQDGRARSQRRPLRVRVHGVRGLGLPDPDLALRRRAGFIDVTRLFPGRSSWMRSALWRLYQQVHRRSARCARRARGVARRPVPPGARGCRVGDARAHSLERGVLGPRPTSPAGRRAARYLRELRVVPRKTGYID